jgi:murein DD-endopeptidase MepM/ murein hydrolase activator NlpD
MTTRKEGLCAITLVVACLVVACLVAPRAALAQSDGPQPPVQDPGPDQAPESNQDTTGQPRDPKDTGNEEVAGGADTSARYPARATSPYLLPWPAGIAYLCAQGNRGVVSHKGAGQYAYDFAMPVGSDVCAARAGVVNKIIVRHDGQGTRAPNNLIAVDHGDGTTGWYLHLKQRGSYVEVGATVRQGQRIGASGNVGRSLIPHLHFHVKDQTGNTIPITFRDVAVDHGIPRMFRHYTSGNTPVRDTGGKK